MTHDLDVPLPDDSREAVDEFVLEYERRYIEEDVQSEDRTVTTEPKTPIRTRATAN